MGGYQPGAGGTPDDDALASVSKKVWRLGGSGAVWVGGAGTRRVARESLSGIGRPAGGMGGRMGLGW